MKNKILPVFALMFCLFQVGFGQVVGVPNRIMYDNVPPKTSPDTAPEIQKSGYLIGPGDVITGKVLGEPQFDFTATIDEDGRFQVPFFEKPIMAKCKTDRELRANVTQLVSKYLKTPLVSVAVTERKSRPMVSVLGEIRTMQNVDLKRKTRLLEIISFSGGTTEEAGGMVQVFRTQPPMCAETHEDIDFAAVAGGGNVPSKMYSLADINKGVDASNPVILPGDIIVVQKAAPVYITGQVLQPTGIRLTGEGLSLSRALAMVGGVSREAKTKDISIYRLKPNSKNIEDREIISANYDAIKKGKQDDIMLKPYDIVEVDKSKKSIGQLVLETALGVGRQAIQTVGVGLPNRVLY